MNNKCYKNSYKSRKVAENSATAIKALGKIPARAALYAYFCKSCNSWHLSRVDSIEFLNKVLKNESKRFKKNGK